MLHLLQPIKNVSNLMHIERKLIPKTVAAALTLILNSNDYQLMKIRHVSSIRQLKNN
jgi:hypothetical protein